jgi:hypothetical protein
MSILSKARPLGLAVLALLLLGTGPTLAAEGDGSGTTRPVLDLSGALDLTTTVSAAAVPEEATGIGPGSHLLIEMDGGLYGCTASYIFESDSTLLLGAAGHCFLPGDTTATHGADRDHDPADTQVRVCVAGCTFGGYSGFLVEGTTVDLGPLAYARQAEEPGGAQVGWDFGVVEIPDALRDQVRTTMPVFGGPDSEGTLATGDQVCHYGNGVGLGEVFLTRARTGTGIFADDDAWFAASAAAPGDSGSALQTCAPSADGLTGLAAIGTLTHLTTLGIAGTTNAQSVAMAADDADLALSLVLGELSSGDDPPGDGDDDGNGQGNTKGKGNGSAKDKDTGRPDDPGSNRRTNR